MESPYTTVLMLSANPKGTATLRLDEERREIAAGLMERSRLRDNFRLITKQAVRPRDFQRAMLDYTPQVVHFSGYGSAEQGLALEDETGLVQRVDADALASLFELFAENLQCVLLNACYSAKQAEAISQHIPFVIGMSDEIGEKAAIEFSVAFYDALGAGRDVAFAYKNACVAIKMAGIPEAHIPVLHQKAELSVVPIQSSGIPAMEHTQMGTQPDLGTSASSQEGNVPLSVFVSYSHQDEALKKELMDHLAPLKRERKILAWHDRDIEAGTEWDAEIKQQLESAQIILLLISPQFIASDYCYDLEMQRAIERHDAGNARVIPIILRPTDWKQSPFSKLASLPKDAKAITTWANRDEAFLDVSQGIRKAVESLVKLREGKGERRGEWPFAPTGSIATNCENPPDSALSNKSTFDDLNAKVKALGDDPNQPSLEELSEMVRDVRQKSPSLDDHTRQRLEQQWQDLQAEWSLRSEKVQTLRRAAVIESGASAKFQLQKQIEAESVELEKLTVSLEQVEQKLGGQPPKK